MFYGKYPNLSGKRYGRMNKYAHLVTTYDAKLKLTLNLPVILYLVVEKDFMTVSGNVGN